MGLHGQTVGNSVEVQGAAWQNLVEGVLLPPSLAVSDDDNLRA